MTPPTTRADVRKTYKLYIGGAFPRSESGHTYEALDAKGKFLANAALASRKDARDAVVAARAAQSGWAGRTAYNRAQVVYRIAEVLEDRRPQFVDAVQRSEGLTARQAGAVVDLSVDRLVWYAGWADKLDQVVGNANPVAGPFFNLSTPEPTGVVAVLAPQDSSLLGLVSVVAPVIVSGNTAVVVSSYARPLPAVTFGEVLATSDVPGGVVNLLTGDATSIGPWLASHMDVNAIDLDRRGRRPRDRDGPRGGRGRQPQAGRAGAGGRAGLDARARAGCDDRVPRDQDGLAPDRDLSPGRSALDVGASGGGHRTHRRLELLGRDRFERLDADLHDLVGVVDEEQLGDPGADVQTARTALVAGGFEPVHRLCHVGTGGAQALALGLQGRGGVAVGLRSGADGDGAALVDPPQAAAGVLGGLVADRPAERGDHVVGDQRGAVERGLDRAGGGGRDRVGVGLLVAARAQREDAAGERRARVVGSCPRRFPSPVC